MTSERMNKKIKARWVKALRSGKYKKGKGALLSDDLYCCLGVLCDLATRSGVIEKAVWKDGATLPLKVQKWAGVESGDPALPTGFTLAETNDGNSGSPARRFSTIADLIEKHL